MSEEEVGNNDDTMPEDEPTTQEIATNDDTSPENDPTTTVTTGTPPQDLEMMFSVLFKVLPFLFLLILFIYYAGANDRFTDSRNIENMLLQATFTGFVAIGITYVMLHGKLDLSAVGLVGLAGYLYVNIANDSSVFAGVAVALVVMIIFGSIHGLLVGGMKSHSALTTLATGTLATAILLRATDLRMEQMEFDPPGLFVNTAGSIPYMMIALILIVLTMDGMRFALKMIFAQDRPEMPDWLWSLLALTAAFVIAAAMIGFGGILMATRLRIAGQPSVGSSILFTALAAAVIGGTHPFGRYGWFTGTLVAVLGISVLINGLILEGANPADRDLYIGGLLILWLFFHAGVTLILDYNKPPTQPSTQPTDSK